jgi:hypothetical protein
MSIKPMHVGAAMRNGIAGLRGYQNGGLHTRKDVVDHET